MHGERKRGVGWLGLSDCTGTSFVWQKIRQARSNALVAGYDDQQDIHTQIHQ